MSTPSFRPGRLSSLMWLAAVLTFAPACASNAGGYPREGVGTRIMDRFAYKPVYPLPPGAPRTKPLYFSGYPGALYGPEGQASPYNPTGYTRRLFHGWRHNHAPQGE